MKRIFSFLPLFLTTLLFAFDGVEWLSEWKSPAVFYIWILMAVVVTAWVFGNAVSWISQIRSNRLLFGTCLGVLVVVILLYPSFRYFSEPYMLHTEAAQQGECAYRRYALPGFEDTLMYSWCFLGYNTRQYAFQAILTGIYGPGSIALNLPYVFHFLLGLVSFWIALEKLVARGYGNRLLLLTVLIIPTQSFYYFFLSNAYEQSFFPYCHALLAFALFIELVLEFRIFKFGIFLIALEWLLFSYTPALGVYFFLVGLFVLWLFFEKPLPRFNRRFAIGFALFFLAHFALSLLYRTDIRLLPDPKFHSFTFSEGMERIIPSIFSFQTTGEDVFSNIFTILIGLLGVVLTFFVKKFRWACLLAAVWMIADILIAGFSKGYAAPLLPFSLHRAVPIFPVLGLLVFFGFGSLKGRLRPVFFTGLTFLIFAVHGAIGSLRAESFFTEMNASRTEKFSSGRALIPIWKSLDDKDFALVILGSIFRTETPLGQFTDATRYFFPGIEVNKKLTPLDRLSPDLLHGKSILFIGESGEAEQYMQQLKVDPSREVRESIRFSPQGLGSELSAFTFR